MNMYMYVCKAYISVTARNLFVTELSTHSGKAPVTNSFGNQKFIRNW